MAPSLHNTLFLYFFRCAPQLVKRDSSHGSASIWQREGQRYEAIELHFVLSFSRHYLPEILMQRNSASVCQGLVVMMVVRALQVTVFK